MKKVLALLLVVCVMCAAGAAFAQGKHRQDFRGNHAPNEFARPEFAQGMNPPEFAPGEPRPDMPMPPHGRFCRPGPEGRRHMRFAPDMTPELRAKVVELEKLKIDLEEALTSRPVNKAKALEVHKKMQTLKNDLDNWRFEKRLEFIEKTANSKPMPKPEEKLEPESEAKHED